MHAHEISKPYWEDWVQTTDTVSLWVWESANLPNTESSISEY
jgi:hypothetical protein